jgi:hypothetical protein
MNLALPGAVGASALNAPRSQHTLRRYTLTPNPEPGAAKVPVTNAQQQQQQQQQKQHHNQHHNRANVPFTDWSLRDAISLDIFDVYDLPRSEASDTDDDASHQSDSEELSARFYSPPTDIPWLIPPHPFHHSPTLAQHISLLFTLIFVLTVPLSQSDCTV